MHREFEEELGVVLDRGGAARDHREHFKIDGVRGHEVVHVFAVASPQLEELPLDAELAVLDNHTTVRGSRSTRCARTTRRSTPTAWSELADTPRRGS